MSITNNPIGMNYCLSLNLLLTTHVSAPPDIRPFSWTMVRNRWPSGRWCKNSKRIGGQVYSWTLVDCTVRSHFPHWGWADCRASSTGNVQWSWQKETWFDCWSQSHGSQRISNHSRGKRSSVREVAAEVVWSIYDHWSGIFECLSSHQLRCHPVFKVLPMANSVFSENLCLYTFHTL